MTPFCNLFMERSSYIHGQQQNYRTQVLTPSLMIWLCMTLPAHLHNLELSLSDFRQLLKTALFQTVPV